MKSLILVCALLLSVSACAQEGGETPPPAATPPPPAPPSLYERLGGVDAITAVVDTFIGKSAADTRINKKFAKSDVTRLRFHLIEQVCNATGGPCDYTGRDMPTTHRGMGVTDGEFDALVENLVATLNQFNVPEAEKNELLAILGPLRGAIVETPGPATGTALPRAFQPAPALAPEKVQAGPIRR